MIKTKKHISWILVLVIAMGFILAQPLAVNASVEDKAIERAVAYLGNMQNNDGGFASIKGAPSSISLTHWSVMALQAAGEDVTSNKWKKNGLSPLDYILHHVELEGTNDYARTLLALRAVGYKGKLNGIDLEEKIVSFQKANGQFAQDDRGEKDLINTHVWSIFALVSSGREIPEKNKAKNWLVAQQNTDGGFSWVVGGGSDPDSTAVAITALTLLGESANSTSIRRSIRYLQEHQNRNGGFGSDLYQTNSASDSWVIQGLIAVGQDPGKGSWDKNGKNPYTHLRGLQNIDGSFNWLENRKSSPVLMTAYAIMALAGKPFPVNIDYNQGSGQPQKIVLIVDQKEAWINGTRKLLDVPPRITNNRVLVPLRFVSESLGADVDWQDEGQKIEIRLGDKKINLAIGEIAEGLDTPPMITEGRILVPIRYISEKLEARVTWFGAERTIEINK